jgi:GNAT superfamily N-acetyltransferase
MPTQIRPAYRKDSSQLLQLMRGLAKFEGYIDKFLVNEEELLERGFSDDCPPEFQAIVADTDGQLIGMLVYYFIPFTFDLRPTLFIKEFFVVRSARGEGIGDALFTATRNVAVEHGCGRIKWDVLSDNAGAQRFYSRQGARHDAKWLGHVLDL